LLKGIFIKGSIIFLLLAATEIGLKAAEAGDILLGIGDSIPLREEPRKDAEIVGFVPVMLYMEIVELSQDGDWYRIRSAESRDYLLSFRKDLWVYHKYTRKVPKHSEVGIGNIVIVCQDSIPLRNDPDTEAEIVCFAPAGLLLQVLEETNDGGWSRVASAEFRDCLKINEQICWASNGDLYSAPEKPRSKITLDVSVFEKGDLLNAQRIHFKDYTYRLNKCYLDTTYYVGSTYLDPHPRTYCCPPLGFCASIFQPGNYFSGQWDLEYTDTNDLEEYLGRFRNLYENGTTTPFYRIKSNYTISEIHEKLVCSKTIFAGPGCYPNNFLGSEIELLREQTHSVGGKEFISAFSFETSNIFKTFFNGGVQDLRFIYTLKILYKDNYLETLVKRIYLWWPMCI